VVGDVIENDWQASNLTSALVWVYDSSHRLNTLTIAHSFLLGRLIFQKAVFQLELKVLSENLTFFPIAILKGYNFYSAKTHKHH
jgi:hypothetical protein